MPINRPFGTDANGNSPAGKPYYEISAEQQESHENEQNRLVLVAFAAETKLKAQHDSGAGYDPNDFDDFVHAKGISASDSIRIKLTVERTGRTIPEVLRDLHLG